MPSPSRRRSLRWATVWCAATSLATIGSGVQATLCSQSESLELGSLVGANKALFQACTTDLKLSTASSATVDALASFIHEDYLQATNADLICASDSCIKALIQAMENLPDCCTPATSTTRNLPRLADDILHQCDVRDAKLLASELEAEIAKLPDLKVQIKSLGTSKDNSTSSSDEFNSVGDGVDVIIDVKKRELMKTGGYDLTPTGATGSNSTVAASSNSAAGDSVAAASAPLLIAAVCTAVQLML